jgi:hypothetical protein
MGEPMKVAIPQMRNARYKRKSNVYTAAWRPACTSKAKTVVADDKTLGVRLEESAEQLRAAGVAMPDDATVEDVVALYMKTPDTLRNALRIHAASKLTPDAGSMTNDEKIEKLAAVNKYKTRIQAVLLDLVFAERETKTMWFPRC